MPVDLVGSVTPTSLAWLLSQDKAPSRSRLVICSNEKVMANVIHDLKAFEPGAEVISLEAFDENPYSGLYPSRDSQLSRIRFLWRAMTSTPKDLFVASIEGLLQKTLPLSLFGDFEITLKKGEECFTS